MTLAIDRGLTGEVHVSYILRRLDHEYYRVFNNILIRNKNTGRTAQIDHIIVSIFGVFVIETKNYTGVVSGDRYDYTWLQETETTHQELYNPIRQNYGHVKALESLLWEGVPIESIVCFLDTADVLVEDKKLIRAYDLEEILKSRKYMLLMLGQVDEICNILKEEILEGEKERLEHGKIVAQAKKLGKTLGVNVFCPKCLRPAIIRHQDKVARFCSDFPKCERPKNIAP